MRSQCGIIPRNMKSMLVVMVGLMASSCTRFSIYGFAFSCIFVRLIIFNIIRIWVAMTVVVVAAATVFFCLFIYFVYCFFLRIMHYCHQRRHCCYSLDFFLSSWSLQFLVTFISSSFNGIVVLELNKYLHVFQMLFVPRIHSLAPFGSSFVRSFVHSNFVYDSKLDVSCTYLRNSIFFCLILLWMFGAYFCLVLFKVVFASI